MEFISSSSLILFILMVLVVEPPVHICHQSRGWLVGIRGRGWVRCARRQATNNNDDNDNATLATEQQPD